eukprot:6106340-Alexandrium_andersonii.AAC.1
MLESWGFGRERQALAASTARSATCGAPSTGATSRLPNMARASTWPSTAWRGTSRARARGARGVELETSER